MITTLADGEFEKLYKLGRTLGQGTFATVKLATCIADRTKWAIKIIKKSALSASDENSLKTEIQIMTKTDHKFIVKVKEVFSSRKYVYIVMELCTGGELFDRIVSKDHYSEKAAKAAIQMVITAVEYCHNNSVVHRDLKPENILYTNAREDATLKLADFGLACVITPTELTNIACGTPGYVAPEIIKGLHYGTSVDMWSVGVILYILLCGFPPFYDDNNKKLFKLIVHAKYSFPDPYWTDISAEAKDLISKLLIVDPAKRLTAAEALKHPWMSDEEKCSAVEIKITDNLRSFNARRRLRGAIAAVQISLKLAKSSKNRSAKNNKEEGEDTSIRSNGGTEDPQGMGMMQPSDTDGDSIKFYQETSSDKMNKFNPALYSCDSSDNDSSVHSIDISGVMSPPISSPNGSSAEIKTISVRKEGPPPRLSQKMLSRIPEQLHSFKSNIDGGGTERGAPSERAMSEKGTEVGEKLTSGGGSDKNASLASLCEKDRVDLKETGAVTESNHEDGASNTAAEIQVN